MNTVNVRKVETMEDEHPLKNTNRFDPPDIQLKKYGYLLENCLMQYQIKYQYVIQDENTSILKENFYIYSI